jgi:hypothetical protein
MCAWADLKRDQQKIYIEWKTFRAFIGASCLDIDPRSIEMCDPNAATPPLPDIRCLVSGELEYFELGEVTEEQLAEAASKAMKERQGVFGGAVSQRKPLVRIFLKKCRNHYTTNGSRLHLILYFAVGRQSPCESQLKQDLDRWRDLLVKRIRRSHFCAVWLLDGWQKRVLVRLDR